MTNGHLCMFYQALYPVERINWCVYALFINDYDRIRRDCLLKTLARTANLAYSLDGYLWAISALAAEKLQIRCVMETHIIKIAPPLQIVDVGNGCEASSANIYIPAKSELTALDSLLPMLSELAPSRTNLQTTPTTSHQAAADKLTFLTSSMSITWLHTTPTSLSASTTQPPTRLPEGPSNKTHKPKYTSVGDTTEPVSLEMFNKAATDLGAKGMINLRKYTTYLAKKDSKPV